MAQYTAHPRRQSITQYFSPLCINSDFINALKQLHNDGFMLAIYNFKDTPDTKRFMPYIDIIRIDVNEKKAQIFFINLLY